MSIASAITAAQGKVADCYTAISNKGGTLPATQNLSNMPTAINSISTGGTIDSLSITPSTSAQTITASGGVDGYSPISVSAVTSSIDANIQAGNIKDGVSILGVTGTYTGGGSGGGYSEFPSYQVSNGVASRRSGALTGNEFSGITSVGNYGLYYAFFYCYSLTGRLDLSSLTSVGDFGLSYTFNRCTGLTSVDLSSLTSVGSSGLAYAFNGCSGLTSVDLSSLTSVGAEGLSYVFNSCTSLTSVDLSSLTTVSDSGLISTFNLCSGLTSLYLPSLTSIGYYGMGNAFYRCSGLTDVYFNSLTTTSFGSYKNQFSYMLNSTGTTTTHTLHFPSNLSSTISSLTGYPTFGGTSGYVTLAFDLPATS